LKKQERWRAKKGENRIGDRSIVEQTAESEENKLATLLITDLSWIN
jgi:hypothetical protein